MLAAPLGEGKRDLLEWPPICQDARTTEYPLCFENIYCTFERPWDGFDGINYRNMTDEVWKQVERPCSTCVCSITDT